MSGSMFLLHMAGAVALLLWATRQVRNSVDRAYGAVLRANLRRTIANPVVSLAAGVGMGVALQSSTAVTLLIASFVGQGMLGGPAGIVVVRGGELGSALVVKLLTFDLEPLVPLCLLAGAVLYLPSERKRRHETGRLLIGIALIIISLQMVSAAAEPLRESRLLPLVIGYLGSDPVSAFLLAGALTYLLHSSIAAMLLLATLADQGVMPVGLGIAMVLGINLGSSFIAPVLTRAAPPAVRAVPLANLMMRGAGSILLLALWLIFRPDLSFLGSGPSEQLVHAHLAFNLLVLALGAPLSGPVWRLSQRLERLWAGPRPEEPEAETFAALVPAALSDPDQALNNATREIVRLCETVDVMLSRIIDLYPAASQEQIEAMRRIDDSVDARSRAIKLYLAQIPRSAMSEREAERLRNLLDVCIKLEQAGDIISRNLLQHVQNKHDRQVEFSPEGWSEIYAFHNAVVRNARLAFNLLVQEDPDTARRVIAEKERLRAMERETQSHHFERLRARDPRSLETSSIHLDTVRDLKQISGLLSTIAHPILEARGLLAESRLESV